MQGRRHHRRSQGAPTLRPLTIRLIAAALSLGALTAVGCSATGGNGGATPSAGPPSIPPGGIEHPLGADELAMQVSVRGGLVPDAVRIGEWPWFNLYGDGTLITQGPQIEIYPPPALPAMVSQSIDENGVQSILRAAQEAGLTDGDAIYDRAEVFDAGTTTFLIDADGRTSNTAVYALGIPGVASSSMPADEKAARAKIDAFAIKLQALPTWLPEASLGIEKQYTPDGLMIFSSPITEPGQTQDDLGPQPQLDWPIDPPLTEFGKPLPGDGVRCGIVTGEDFDAVWSAAESANQLTPWASEGKDYSLVFRPKLPDETTCS